MEGTFSALWGRDGARRVPRPRLRRLGGRERGVCRRGRRERTGTVSVRSRLGHGGHRGLSFAPPDPCTHPLAYHHSAPAALDRLPAPPPLSRRSGCKLVRGWWGGVRVGVHRGGGGGRGRAAHPRGASSGWSCVAPAASAQPGPREEEAGRLAPARLTNHVYLNSSAVRRALAGKALENWTHQLF